MNNDIEAFLKALQPPAKGLSEADFFLQGAELLRVQIDEFLKGQGQSSRSFTDAIAKARAIPEKDTINRFWHGVDSFRQVCDSYADPNSASCNARKKWIRFINIIEDLQEYSGANIFPMRDIATKRIVRLYFAYMLTWEHLRYIAGNDDDFSPSSDILEAYGADLEDDYEEGQDDGLGYEIDS